jgi:hypothetical protein
MLNVLYQFHFLVVTHCSQTKTLRALGTTIATGRDEMFFSRLSTGVYDFSALPELKAGGKSGPWRS